MAAAVGRAAAQVARVAVEARPAVAGARVALAVAAAAGEARPARAVEPAPPVVAHAGLVGAALAVAAAPAVDFTSFPAEAGEALAHVRPSAITVEIAVIGAVEQTAFETPMSAIAIATVTANMPFDLQHRTSPLAAALPPSVWVPAHANI